jgi:hypothetical protein
VKGDIRDRRLCLTSRLEIFSDVINLVCVTRSAAGGSNSTASQPPSQAAVFQDPLRPGSTETTGEQVVPELDAPQGPGLDALVSLRYLSPLSILTLRYHHLFNVCLFRPLPFSRVRAFIMFIRIPALRQEESALWCAGGISVQTLGAFLDYQRQRSRGAQKKGPLSFVSYQRVNQETQFV